jgi:2-dehydro-3-deoxyphosphooctonate aldolase (KDO 8-P synthase)
VESSRDHRAGRRLAAIAAAARSALFKSSFDKANRSSLSSYRGPGIEAGLATLRAVKNETGLPLLTDVHEPSQVGLAVAVADVLQVPPSSAVRPT